MRGKGTWAACTEDKGCIWLGEREAVYVAGLLVMQETGITVHIVCVADKKEELGYPHHVWGSTQQPVEWDGAGMVVGRVLPV